MIASLCDNVGRANVVTAVMDAEALSFADSVFDGVYSMFGMLFLVDVGQGVEEMVRVTKPGGRCVIATWRGPEKSRLLAPIAAAVTAMMPDSPVARKLHEPPPLSDPSELRERMKQAGLGDITIREVSHPLKMTKDAYLREFPQANPAGLEMQRRMPEQAFTQLGVAIRNQLDAEFPSNEISLLGVAHIAAGFKSLGAIR